MAMTSFPSSADTVVDSKYASKNVSLYLKNDQPTSIQMKLMIHYIKFSKWEMGLALLQIKLIIFPNNRCAHVFSYGNREITSVDLEKFVFLLSCA